MRAVLIGLQWAVLIEGVTRDGRYNLKSALIDREAVR